MPDNASNDSSSKAKNQTGLLLGKEAYSNNFDDSLLGFYSSTSLEDSMPAKSNIHLFSNKNSGAFIEQDSKWEFPREKYSLKVFIFSSLILILFEY
jgi:hypothetical protein